MEKIKVLWLSGLNGSATYSIFNGKGEKVITNKPIEIIVEEIKRIYPKIAEEIRIKSRSYDFDSIKSINLSTMQPSLRQKIVELIKETKFSYK